jgi:Na+/H+ antiporter NhaD/arsenite permease-like protein
MLVTNDVALLTFVPFAVVVLGLAHQEKELVWVVVLQTVAANLGSMLTPVGNPQNLFLFSYYNFSMAQFIMATLPVWALSLVLVLMLCMKLPRAHVEIFLGEEPILHRKKLALYAALFVLCMLEVLHVIRWELMLGIIALVLLVWDKKRLMHADFLLLLTFVCFFVFAGNLARLEPVKNALSALLSGRELFCGIGASQVISNVPAALLLSGFTEKGKELLLGVNIGGLGTPVASLASLISMKLYSHSESASLSAFMKCFLAVNFALLIVLTLFALII